MRIGQGRSPFTREQLETLVFAVFLGVVLGGRIGYFLLYARDMLISKPFEIFHVWHGGMSFHGGLLGVIIALVWCSRRFKISFLRITDEIATPAALGLAFGRIGNFVIGELPGGVRGGEWGVVFPSIDMVPRHPSQLYSMVKDVIIAGVLWVIVSRKKMPVGVASFGFLALYGTLRTVVEGMWREPLDGYIGIFTLGQVYSVPLIVVGVCGLIWILVGLWRR